MVALINGTPHDINVLNEDGEPVLTLRHNRKTVVRLQVEETPDDPIKVGGTEIPTVSKTFGEAENLPEPRDGVLIVVSAAVKRAFPNRDDLVVPNDMVFEDGQPKGCRSLGR